jgi:dUTP pyrophosphatase
MNRGFEVVSTYTNEDVALPLRETANAAGYDIRAAKDFIVPKGGQIVLVPTGVKAFMESDEFLMLVNRSSGPIKRGLVMPNSVGIIDADYYNTDQEIKWQVMNIGTEDVEIKKGERIAQGIFMKYLRADNDSASGSRTGGFGSTGEE